MSRPFCQVVALTMVLSAVAPALAEVSLAACLNTVQDMINEDPSVVNDTSLFAVVPANFSSPVITLALCKARCSGDENQINPQCGVRLFQWVLPAVLLAGSVQTPPVVWWKRLWAISRPVSDPLGSFLSMRYVLKAYALCQRAAKSIALTMAPRRRDFRRRQRLARSLAAILHGIRDLNPTVKIRAIGTSLESAIRQSHLPDIDCIIHRAAGLIMHNRDCEMWKAYIPTAVALANIVFSMILPAAPGSQPVSGATIASALALSTLILAVLLSNAIGEHKSLYVLCDIIDGFVVKLEQPNDNNNAVGAAAASSPPPAASELRETIGLTKTNDVKRRLLASTASMYFQPQLFSDPELRSERLCDAILLAVFLSVVPVALVGASGALAAPPSYFNDRIFLFVAIACVWLASPVLTAALAVAYSGRGRLWAVVAAKDALVAGGFVFFLASITCGLGGDCKMWSGYYRYGPGGARIPLNPVDDFYWNGYVLYPALVSVCVGWNLAAYFGIRYFAYLGRWLARFVPCFQSRYYSGATADAFDMLAWSDHEIEAALVD